MSAEDNALAYLPFTGISTRVKIIYVKADVLVLHSGLRLKFRK
jgi:hypothetical protein